MLTCVKNYLWWSTLLPTLPEGFDVFRLVCIFMCGKLNDAPIISGVGTTGLPKLDSLAFCTCSDMSHSNNILMCVFAHAQWDYDVSWRTSIRPVVSISLFTVMYISERIYKSSASIIMDQNAKVPVVQPPDSWELQVCNRDCKPRVRWLSAEWQSLHWSITCSTLSER